MGRNPFRGNLNSLVVWPGAGRLLDLPLSGAALPARTACPTCGGPLLVFEDSTAGGCWQHCSACGSGDLIQLAARVWNTDLPEAVSRLVAEGVLADDFAPDAVPVYVSEWADYRVAVTATWERAKQGRLRRDPAALAMLRTLRLDPGEMSAERLAAGPARWCGLTTIQAFERQLMPGSWDRTDKRAKGHEVVRGRGWREIVVTPAWAAPGLIAGFHVAGRRGAAEDQVFWSVPRHSRPRVRREAGLVGLDVVHELPDDRVLGMSCALELLQLQTQQFRRSLRPLPLVGWHESPAGCTREAWAALAGRRLVLWDRQPSAGLFEQARQTGARVVLVQPRAARGTLETWLSNQDLDRLPELLDRLTERSQPWEDVLRGLLRNRPPAETASLTRELVARSEGWLDVLGELLPGREGAQRLHLQTVSPAGGGKTGQVRIVERPSGLYSVSVHRYRHQQLERQLCNGLVRADHLFRRPEGDEYAGRLTIGGQTAFWRLPADRPQHFAEALRRAARGAGLPLRMQAAGGLHGHSLLAVVCLLQAPENTAVDILIGWNGKEFRFKNFALDAGGLRSLPWACMPEDSPGPPGQAFKLKSHMLPELTADPAATWGWSLLVALLAAVCSPRTGWKVPEVVLVAEDCPRALHDVLEPLGLAPRPAEGLTRWNHHWPAVARIQGSLAEQERWVQNHASPWVWPMVDAAVAYSLAGSGRYLLVDWPHRLAALEPIRESAWMQAGLGFLRDTAAGGQAPADDGRPAWEQTAERLQDWFAARGGGRIDPGCLLPPGLPSELRAVRLAEALYRLGRLRPGLQVGTSRGHVTVPFRDGRLQVAAGSLRLAAASAGLAWLDPHPGDLELDSAVLLLRS